MLEQRALFTTPAGATYRLLGVSTRRAKQVAYIFSMEDRKALPKALPLEELREGLEAKEYVRVKSTMPMVVKTPSSTVHANKGKESRTYVLFKWRRELIEPLVSDERIYERKHRGPLVAKRARDTKASEQTIMTCLRLYWRGGMTFDALMPELHKCGTPVNPVDGPRPKNTRGRKPKRYTTFQWPDDLRPKVVRTLKTVLKKTPKASHPLLYRRVLKAHFSTEQIVEKDGKRKVLLKQLPLGQRPSRTQLYYLINTTFSMEERLRHKHGDDGYENNVEPKTGSARQYASFAGNMYEIDATKVDCWVVDEDDPLTVIGKATLYLVVDVFTRLIVGFHLSLDAPSWSSAMEALLSLVEDKQVLCERWGFEYREEDWKAHGVVPAFIRADRGSEFTSFARDVLTDGLGIHFVNTPARKSPTKGTVECAHKLIHVPIRENVGGYTPPEEFGKRQLGDRRKEATRTLKSLGCEILSSIRLHNHKVHRRIQLPAAQVWAQEQPIPSRMWELSTKRSVGQHTTQPEEFMRFKLLPAVEKLSVTPRGVYFDGLLYVPDKAVRKQWLLPATRGFYKVSATYERRSVAAIYVHDKKDPTKWTTMHLHPEFAQHHGRSWAQFEALKEVKLKLDDLAAEHNLALELQNDHEAAEREAASSAVAQKAIKAAKSKSRTADTAAKRGAATDKEHSKVPVLPTSAIPAPLPPPQSKAAYAGASAPVPPSPSTDSSAPKLATTSANSAFQALLKLKANT